MVHSLMTDIPSLTSTSHYLDDSTPSGGAETQCTGDAQAIGQSGPWVSSNLPNTDPRTAGFNSLSSTRTIYFEAPGKANGAGARGPGREPVPVHRVELCPSGRAGSASPTIPFSTSSSWRGSTPCSRS